MNAQLQQYDIIIVGAGSAGIACASSLLKRAPDLSILMIDPSEDHYYQPGWTMVGGGVFDAKSTHRKTHNLIPSRSEWLQDSVVAIDGTNNSVSLASGKSLSYSHLVMAPGLKLDWDGVEGLQQALGKNGVTSNYRYDLAPYTWELVQKLEHGKALFTQPPMPIKCAGAPQKALYLSASEWLKQGRLDNVDIQFFNSAPVLFGVADYVPALMEYVEKYRANLNFGQTLTKVDGETRQAWFRDGEGNESSTDFDFLHVCPPQTAPDFIKASDLSDDSGWMTVDPATLQSSKYDNIWGLGDVTNTTNAKTMAAARKQAPVVAINIVNTMQGESARAHYEGYGSCPLTVENGKIVLAEFSYGGELTPTFPNWLNNGTTATSLAWFLKASILPSVYWQGMLKGREWFAGPKIQG